MAVIGIFMVIGAVGTSDYYVMELGQSEPESVWKVIWIGAALMLPTFLHIIYENVKEK